MKDTQKRFPCSCVIDLIQTQRKVKLVNIESSFDFSNARCVDDVTKKQIVDLYNECFTREDHDQLYSVPAPCLEEWECNCNARLGEPNIHLLPMIENLDELEKALWDIGVNIEHHSHGSKEWFSIEGFVESNYFLSKEIAEYFLKGFADATNLRQVKPVIF